MTEIKLEINIPAIAGALESTISRVIRSVSFGLRAVEQLASVSDDLPDAFFQLKLDDGLEPSVEEMRATFAQWILTSGLRDVVETVGTTLEEARKLLTILNLVDPDGTITGKKYLEAVKGTASFRRLGLPAKLSDLEGLLGEEILPPSKDQIVSINNARNCLVHRRGVVAERDCNTDGSLEVRWTQWDAVIIQPDGAEVIAEGETIAEAGARLELRRSSTSKVFQVGDTVMFSQQEFVNLCLTLLLFGRGLVAGVEEYGQRRNLLGKREGEVSELADELEREGN